MIEDQSPLKTFVQQEIAAHGWAIADEQVARRMRPFLFGDYRGAARDEHEWMINDARQRGILYSAKLEGVGQVPVIALSTAKLAERMGWQGITVESIQPWVEPEPEHVPTHEEVAEREAEHQAFVQKMGFYPGPPERAADAS